MKVLDSIENPDLKKFSMNNKRVTLSDIASKTGLSKGAVSFALRNSKMVSEKTRAKVLSAAKKLGYERSALVSSVMSSIKRGGGFLESVALLNANEDEYILSKHPTLSKYCIGIKEEAKLLGYSVNEIWLRDPRLEISKLMRAFRSRSIRGGIVIGHFLGEVFKPKYSPIWENFSFVSIGVKSSESPLELVSTDHYAVTSEALSKCLKLGFTRPGLVMEKIIDEYVDGRFIAGYLRMQLDMPEQNRIPPFTASMREPGYPKKFSEWIMRYKPDALLYLRNSLREIFLDLPAKTKRNIRLVQLERRSDATDWIGMEQNNDAVGRVAMRRLADMLNKEPGHIGENADLVTLVSPKWFGPNL